jgi:plasmid stabilization system protein ParE
MAYEVIISDEVFDTLNSIVLYLEKRWSKKVAENFLSTFYEKVDAIAVNPTIGRKSGRQPSIRKILITKHNMLYYEINGNRIELLTIFFTAQDPSKNIFE